MMASLTVTLAVLRKEFLRGESVPFEVVVKNTSGGRLTDMPTLNPLNRCMTLVLNGPRGGSSADQLSPEERDGSHLQESARPLTKTLAPGEAMTVRDDLLSWFGELAPGRYSATASYGSGMLEASSSAVRFDVRPAQPVLLVTPRCAQQAPGALISVAWVHQGAEGFDLLFQQQSPALARNVRHAVRVSKTEELLEAWPAIETIPDQIGHVIWLDRRGRLQFCAIAEDHQQVTPVADVRMPFAGRPLTSPASMPDGAVFAAVTDTKRQLVSVLRIDRQGGSKSYELDLGKTTPLGPYVCFWEFDHFLHLAWTTPNGRDIQYARLPLSDPASGFAVRPLVLTDEPILALEAYLDLEAPQREREMLQYSLAPEELASATPLLRPKVMFWCVTRAEGRLIFARVDSGGRRDPVTAIETGGPTALRVHRSVVTSRNELALILADTDNRLYYASTARRALLPLANVAGTEITLEDQPGLLASSRAAIRDWVHLAYLDRRKDTIAYTRLEPDDELDPVERSGEMRGRGVAEVS